MAAVRSLGGGRGRAGAGPTTRRPPHRPLRPAALPARAPARAGRGRAVAEGREAEAEAEAAGAVETVAVGLGARSYPIYIGAGLLAAERPFLRRHLAGKQVLVVTNETVGPLHLAKVLDILAGAEEDLQVETVVLRDGEEHKNMAELMKVWEKALTARLSRKAVFVALGGGVIGDMVGFAAASYQRGVDFIQVPTTVMAMVDSSVGGKTGVNHPQGKNMIGAFHQPRSVVMDTQVLDTLPDREFVSGLPEVVKYGLIRDAAFFAWQEEHWDRVLARDPEALAYAMKRSCINKAEIVELDEKESGVRATLNLGHTFGHAVETWTGYGTFLHGEAVAIGTMMALDLSARLGWIDPSIGDRTQALFERAGLPTAAPEGMGPEDFRHLMALDKKNVDARLRLVLLKGGVGDCVITEDFDDAMLSETLALFCGGGSWPTR